MGKIKQGILGGFSGSVGGVVGSSWKGINVMKAKPVSVANPKTAGQIAQRTKMTNVTAFAIVLLANLIKPLWDRFQTGKSGYNAFVSQNISLFAAALPNPYADLVISKGKMAETVITSLTSQDGQAVVAVNWGDDIGEGYKLATDEAYAVVINETNGDYAYAAADDTRTDASTNVTLPSAVSSGDTLHAYLSFRRADGTVVSNTGYATDDVA